MEKILTATEAAEIIGVSKMTMSEWCQRGYVPNAQKVSIYWAIPESSLESIERPRMGRPRNKKKQEEENRETEAGTDKDNKVTGGEKGE